MGVNLTDSSRRELSGVSASEYVNAQKALSRGIVAQQSGNEFDAMFNYFDAKKFNVNTAEIPERMVNATTTLVSTGGYNSSIRNRVLGEIERMIEAARAEKERNDNIRA